jgi:hypothetical protein
MDWPLIALAVLAAIGFALPSIGRWMDRKDEEENDRRFGD